MSMHIPQHDNIFAISGRSVREAGVCSDKHNIYVLGGKPDDLAAQKFDVRYGIWYSMPEMIRPRRCTGNVDSLYASVFASKPLQHIKLHFPCISK